MSQPGLVESCIVLPSDNELLVCLFVWIFFNFILSRIFFEILNSPNEFNNWPGEIDSSVEVTNVDDADNEHDDSSYNLSGGSTMM